MMRYRHLASSFGFLGRSPKHYSVPLRRSQSTLATFHYLSPLEEYSTVKPFHINVPAGGIPGGSHTNEVSEPYSDVAVHNIRGQEDLYSLDLQGFEVVNGEENHFVDDILGAMEPEEYKHSEQIMSRVGPKVEAFLKHQLGAEAVMSFAFRYRQRGSQFPRLARGTDPNVAQPVQGVHADFTGDYARTTATFVVGIRKYADVALHERRWQIISAWRPLYGPLYDWPLAVLDVRTLDHYRDLVASDNVYPHQVSETFNVFYHPEHRWCYLGGQRPNEILLFKAFDSKTTGGVARVCPHAAFELTDKPTGTRPRQSIECVNLVLYPRGTGEPNPKETLPCETPRDQDPVGAFNF